MLAQDGDKEKNGCAGVVWFAVNLLLNSYICVKGRFDMRIIFPS